MAQPDGKGDKKEKDVRKALVGLVREYARHCSNGTSVGLEEIRRIEVLVEAL